MEKKTDSDREERRSTDKELCCHPFSPCSLFLLFFPSFFLFLFPFFMEAESTR